MTEFPSYLSSFTVGRMSKRLCLFCSAPLGPGPKSSPEHILLNALGGRATTRRVVCTACNNRFGGTIDKAFAGQVEPIRSLLNLKSGENRSPASLSYKSALGRHTLHPDGNISTFTKPLTFTPGPDGVVKVSLTLNALEEINRFIPNIVAKTGLSEGEIRRRIEAADAKFVSSPAPSFTANIMLGGFDPLRSMVKACLVLCAARTDVEATRGTPFKFARNFVTLGTSDFQSTKIVLEGRDIPGTEKLTEKYGPIFNMIFCKSDAFGRMIVYYGLYNAAYWHITLAEKDAPPNKTFGVISDPRNPSCWGYLDAQKFDIETSWMTSPVLGTGERISYSLQVAFDQRNEEQRHDCLSKIFQDTMLQCGLKYGDLITQDFINRFSRRVAFWWVRATFEQRLSPDQLRAALGAIT